MTREEAEEMCKRLEVQSYFETSASSNLNVDQLFFTVAMKAYEIEMMMQKIQDENPYQMGQSYGSAEKIRGRTSTNIQLDNYLSVNRKGRSRCCK